MSDYFSHTLQKDEDVVIFLRKHPMTFLIPLLKSAVVIAIPLILIKYLLSNKWLSVVFFGIILIGLLMLLYEWYTWYLDSYLITNKRIIYINQKGLFSREVRETPYEKIQDVTFKIEGILATIFNFGHVSIYTTVSKDPLVIGSVPSPEEVREKIVEVKQKINTSAGSELSAEELVKYIEKVKVGRFTKKIQITPSKKKIDNGVDGIGENKK